VQPTRASSPPPTVDLLFPTHSSRPVPVPGPPAAPTPPRPAVTHLTVSPWPDPVIDRMGIDPFADYLERYWLGIVGPASVLLVRHLAARFEHEPDGFVLDLAHTARVLGLGTGLGRWGPVQRTVHRCAGFGFVRRWGDDRLLVRRRLPPVTRQQLARLPEDRQHEHEQWRAAALRAEPITPRSG